MRKAFMAMSALVFGVVLSVLMIEVGMRVAGLSYPIFFVPDPMAGGHMWPHLKAWWNHEGNAYVEVNSFGYRDKEHDKTKGQNEFRIAFLGDSFTAALQVDFEDTYLSVIRRELAHCQALSGREVVPMNFGISGFGTAQAITVLQGLAWDFDPDLVVLNFTANDFTDNSPAWGGRGVKPFYVFDEKGLLVRDDSFRTSPAFVKRNSSLSQWRREFIQQSRFLQLLVELRAALSRRQLTAKAELTVGGRFQRPPEEEKVKDAWRVTEGVLSLFAEEVRARDRDFVLLVTPSGKQVNPDPEYRAQRMEVIGPENLFYWNRRIQAFAEEREMEVVNLDQEMFDYSVRNQVCLYGFENAVPCGGHWNEEGHRLAGERTAESICALLESSNAKDPLVPR